MYVYVDVYHRKRLSTVTGGRAPGKFVCYVPGRKRRSQGCQDVVPNANDVVDSHLTRDYPLNGGVAFWKSLVQPLLGETMITKLKFTSELHCS